MNTLTRDELWKRLSEEGLVSGDPHVAAESQSPWPVRAMLGIAGWLGALFLLGFAGFAFAILFRSAAAALPAGVVCCVAAYATFRGMPRNDFAGQFGFAISLAGQALVFVGLSKIVGDHPSAGTYLLMAAVEAALAIAIPNYIHRIFTAFAANICLFSATAIMGVPALATVAASVGAALIWLNQIRMAERPSLWEPLGYGFAIALLYLDSALMIGPGFWRILLPGGAVVPHFLLWTCPVAAGLVFVYVVLQLRQRAGVEAGSRGGIFTVAAAIVLALCGLAAPGISAAILILVLGFANGNRVLMGLGVLAFGGYLSHFYYELSSTLLVKSMVLAATGAALLGLRWIIARFLPAEEGTNA
jgi:Domain of unknown function (DUF4401)